MKAFLEKIRPTESTLAMRKCILNTLLILVFGLAMGVLAKLLDIFTENIGNVFSQMSVWILIGTILATRSNSPFRAMLNVFVFSFGMLCTYYVTAALTESVYSSMFIYGWAAFALCSPVFSFVAWYAKGSSLFSMLISFLILVSMALCAIVLFDRIRVADIIILIVTGAYLFPNKKRQNKEST